MSFRWVAVLIAGFVLWGELPARDFYVSPQGSASGDGSIARPWDLQTALSQPHAVKPGDTIWLRGGTYAEPQFISRLTGTPEAPIIVRQYPGERATLDGAGATPKETETLQLKGAYTWYWGFEITNSDPVRVVPGTCARNNAITLSSSTGLKLINLVIHDAGQGIGNSSAALDSEVYGTLIYNNGCVDSLRGHGHGIYVQGLITDSKKMIDNIIFNQTGTGIHGYGSKAASLDNFYLEGNVLFNNGVLAEPGDFSGNRNILIGGGTPAKNPTLVGNFGYYPMKAPRAANFTMGYKYGADNIVLKNNYIAGGLQTLQFACTQGPCQYGQISGNTIIGTVENVAGSPYPSEQDVSYLSPPSRIDIFVRPNRYEIGRSNIVIYNWEMQDSVFVDGAPLGLRVGDEYELRAAQSYFSGAVTGVYNGSPIEVPMKDWAVAPPIGLLGAAPVSTFPQFGAFILQIKPASPTEKPAPNKPRAPVVLSRVSNSPSSR
jgi:hypothetical protein